MAVDRFFRKFHRKENLSNKKLGNFNYLVIVNLTKLYVCWCILCSWIKIWIKKKFAKDYCKNIVAQYQKNLFKTSNISILEDLSKCWITENREKNPCSKGHSQILRDKTKFDDNAAVNWEILEISTLNTKQLNQN